MISESAHGCGIAKRIQLLSGDVLLVQQGSLYPALHRQLERELETWNRLSSAVQLVIERA